MKPNACATNRALVLLPLALVPSMAMTMWFEFKWLLIGKKFRLPQWLGGARVPDGRAEAGRRWSRQLLEKIWERFFHAGRILDANALNFQSQDGETHRHAMIVISLNLRPVQRALGGKDGQIVVLLLDAGAAPGQLSFQRSHPLTFLHAQPL